MTPFPDPSRTCLRHWRPATANNPLHCVSTASNELGSPAPNSCATWSPMHPLECTLWCQLDTSVARRSRAPGCDPQGRLIGWRDLAFNAAELSLLGVPDEPIASPGDAPSMWPALASLHKQGTPDLITDYLLDEVLSAEPTHGRPCAGRTGRYRWLHDRRPPRCDGAGAERSVIDRPRRRLGPGGGAASRRTGIRRMLAPSGVEPRHSFRSRRRGPPPRRRRADRHAARPWRGERGRSDGRGGVESERAPRRGAVRPRLSSGQCLNHRSARLAAGRPCRCRPSRRYVARCHPALPRG